ncbi:MAG: CHAT domain-containing protein, partial [Crocosphaera sp.]
QSLVSYTVRTIGRFYENLSHHNFDKEFHKKAKALTQEALYLAQPKINPYLAYQWQWQLSRIEKLQGNNNQAITNYKLAIKTLETVRKNILTIKQDVQFSFRDNIEPLYREFMSSLLESQSKNIDPNILETILQQVDILQLAELENFLQCDLSSQTNLNEITDSHSLIIYPIVLKDKLVVIYKIPEKNYQIDFKTINISNKEFTQTLKLLQNDLGEIGNQPDIIQQSQQVYQWIIKPLETVLKDNQQIDTLVFILDGILRNIPMSVLYDAENKEYLLQKNYAIAVVPGLNLLQNKTSSLTPNIFLGGVELKQELDENLVFDKIQYLRQELNEISAIIPNSKQLINESFTKSNLEQELENNQYSIIHWKTHGVFSSNPDDTYIVAYNGLLKTNDINQLINAGSQEKSQPIDLLVLSACETAKGDNRAVLGLAGIAVRSGVSSTLSTLWRADDLANTQLMKDFYKVLFQPNMSKAKALRQAQLSLYNSNIAYQDPHYWASYILVGNWL